MYAIIVSPDFSGCAHTGSMQVDLMSEGMGVRGAVQCSAVQWSQAGISDISPVVDVGFLGIWYGDLGKRGVLVSPSWWWVRFGVESGWGVLVEDVSLHYYAVIIME